MVCPSRVGGLGTPLAFLYVPLHYPALRYAVLRRLPRPGGARRLLVPPPQRWRPGRHLGARRALLEPCVADCRDLWARAVRTLRPPQRWLWPALWCSPRTVTAVRPSGRHRCARRALLWPCVLVAVLWPAPRCSPRTARAVRFRPAPWCSPRTAMTVCPCCRALAGTEVLAAHCRGCVLSSAAVHGRELAVRFERRTLAAVALLAPCVITLTSRHRSRLAAPLLPYQ
jgi:hypothetical protein